MRKLFSLLMASLIAIPAIAQNEISCSYVNLSGDIGYNKTLYADTIYRLDGCVRVINNHVLTIQAGTKIIGRKNSNKGALIIDRGSKLVAIGTAMNRITFTSDQTPGNKLPGDWTGIVIAGNDYTNASGGTITMGSGCLATTGGGEDDEDNSGELKYVNIDFAQDALTLLCVGSETEIDYVKAGNAANNSFQLRGGSVPLIHPVSVDPTGNDFLFSDGNISNSQYGLSLRLDLSAHISGSSAVVIQNDGNGSSNTPYTHPVLSNYTLMGPWSCSGSPSSDFKHGVVFENNGQGEFYNSLIRGWNYGLGILGTSKNHISGSLVFSYNTFYLNQNVNTFDGVWPTGCSLDMDDWLFGSSTCSQMGNEDLSSGLGYNANICSNYPYSSNAPTWSVTSTSMASPDYSAASLSDFDNPTNRAAFDATDWTSPWVLWYPQGYNVCPSPRQPMTTGMDNLPNTENTYLQIVPNPSFGVTNAVFTTEQTGTAQVIITNSVGQVVRSIDINIATKGKQQVAINTDGLSSGMYIVNVSLAENWKAHAKLLIK